MRDRLTRTSAAGALAGALVVGVALSLPGEAAATFPGYDGLIAFSGGTPGRVPDISVVDPDGTDQTNITSSPTPHEVEPAWSPDGTKLVFADHAAASPYKHIFVMNADGSNRQQLTTVPSHNSGPAWSPDGAKIVFSSTRPDPAQAAANHIWVMDADGGNPTQLTSGMDERSPDWSPDGSSIAFEGNDSTGVGRYIYVVSATGGSPVAVTGADGNSDPSYSPDGSKIAFVSNRSDNYADIWVMQADGANPTRLTTHTLFDLFPVWSPDGTKIAFTSDRQVVTQMQLWVMNADGSNQHQIISGHAEEQHSPSWQRTTTPPPPPPAEPPPPAVPPPPAKQPVSPAARCVVPKVKGKARRTAERSIRRAGCTVGWVSLKRTRLKPNRVLAQNPAAGRRLKHKAKVHLVVSRPMRRTDV